MPTNHSRKQDIRERMAATGETYREAFAALNRDRWAAEGARCTGPRHDRGDGWGSNCAIPDCPECAEGRRRGEADRKAYEAELTAYQCPGPTLCDWIDCPQGCNPDDPISMCACCGAVDLPLDCRACPHCAEPR
jgi:hypothetical protein